MVCNMNCPSQPCAVTGGNYSITLSSPDSANEGDIVEVPFSVSVTCQYCLRRSFIACLFDDRSGKCVISSDVTSFQPLSDEPVSMILKYPQPSTDFHGSISLLGIGIVEANECYDVKSFSVKTIAPPGQGWTCNQSNKTCYPDPNSTTSHDQCFAECTGGGGGGAAVACTESDYKVLGICVPKVAIFGAFVLGALYVMSKK